MLTKTRRERERARLNLSRDKVCCKMARLERAFLAVSHTPLGLCLSLFLSCAPHSALFPGSKKTAVTPQLKDRLDRLSVIWCVRNGRPWHALKDVGHKLLMAEFVPEYAASSTSHATLDTILSRIYNEAKTSLIAQLTSTGILQQ